MSYNFENIITVIREMRSPSFLDINEEKLSSFSDKILYPDLFVTGDRFLVSNFQYFKKNCANFLSFSKQFLKKYFH
jgi:hypothetical protein